MKRKIAIYARQSVDKKDSLSIETQVEFCKNFINSKPTKEPVEVYFDKGYSGKNTIRPEFQRLLMDVREDTVSKIVVYKLDRISRNLLDFTSMYQEFENHKVEFCSVSEVFDIKARLNELGAMAAVMTGSGTAVFGIFKTLDDAAAAQKKLNAAEWRSWVACPVKCGVEIE